VLSAFFGRAGIPVQQFAMDLRDREIATARRRYAATERLFRRLGSPAIRGGTSATEFVADDATRLVGYGQVPAVFDVIVIRHQNLWHDEAVWRRIFEFALDRIDEPVGGRLILTSYFDREHLRALQMLAELGGEVIVSEVNPRTRPLPFQGKSVDRHVAVLRNRRRTEAAITAFPERP
jgi:hypothetical protein